MNVFISHNKLDKSVAKEIAIFLSAENVGVWFDEWEILAGDSITEKISDGLKSCTHFIILWSKNSSKSSWVNRELFSIIEPLSMVTLNCTKNGRLKMYHF